MNRDRNDTFYNRSLERALQILNVFKNDKTALTVAQLSEFLKLPRATVLRLCTTLVKYDYLKQDQVSKKYSLGLKLFELGSIVFNSLSLRQVASPYLNQLQVRLGKTIFLGILENDELLYIDKREDPTNPISFTSKIGMSRPPNWGMLGSLLMAYLPEREIERLLHKVPLIINSAGPRGPEASGIKAEWPRSVTKRGAQPANPTAARRDAMSMPADARLRPGTPTQVFCLASNSHT